MTQVVEREIAPGIRMTFASPVDALSFLEEELKRWERMSEVKTRHPSLRYHVVEQQLNLLRQIVGVAKESVRNKKPEALADHVALFSESREGTRALCSLIPADAAVLTLAETDPDASVFGMAARMRSGDVINNIQSEFRGDAILALHRFAMAAYSEPGHAAAFESLQKQAHAVIESWSIEVGQAVEKATKTTEQANIREKELKKLAEEHSKSHGELITAHAQALKDIEGKFVEQMALRGPVKYWTDRATAGRNAAWGWLVGFGVAAVVIFFGVVWTGPELLTLLKDDKGQISLAAVPLLIAALIPLLWLLRHLARMFADNIADARDAAQRSSLTSAFLALSANEEVEFNEAERAIIVQALFRPSPAQPADDGVPLPVLELLKSRP